VATVLFTVLPDFDALPLEISASEEAHSDPGVVKKQTAEAPVLSVKDPLSNGTVVPDFALDVEGLLRVGREILEGEVDSVLGGGAVLDVLLDVEFLGTLLRLPYDHMLAIDEMENSSTLRGKPRNGHELMLLVGLSTAFDVGDSVEDLLHILGDLRGERVNAG
jgi:hypothetical protein